MINGFVVLLFSSTSANVKTLVSAMINKKIKPQINNQFTQITTYHQYYSRKNLTEMRQFNVKIQFADHSKREI